MDLLVMLFNEFETLDAFGPVEVLGKLEQISHITFISAEGGRITSSQRVLVITAAYHPGELPAEYILLIPGGMGVRAELENKDLQDKILRLAGGARYVLTVCTGSALLARTGFLDQKKATTNKRVYDWAIRQGAKVKWIKKARWVKDGNVYTSSGVSAGIDMALGFIADVYGLETAEGIANGIEYSWNQDSEDDAFAALY